MNSGNRTRPTAWGLALAAVLAAIAPLCLFAASPEPSAPQPAPVKAIWDYQSELGLSTAQVSQLKDITGKLQKEVQAYRQQILPIDAQIRKMVDSRSPITAIKAKLQEVSEIEVAMRCADIEASWKLNDVLLPRQAQEWKNLRAHPPIGTGD